MSDPRHRLEPGESPGPAQYVPEPEPHIHSGEGPEQWDEEAEEPTVSSLQPPTVPVAPEEPDPAE
jgi:hypothetical protein